MPEPPVSERASVRLAEDKGGGLRIDVRRQVLSQRVAKERWEADASSLIGLRRPRSRAGLPVGCENVITRRCTH
jgi:hypothetical protein